MDSKNSLNLPLTGFSLALALASVWVVPLSFLIWFAFVPYFLGTKCLSPLRSAFAGLIFGTLFFSGFLYWIFYYEPRILFIVLAFTAPYFALLGFMVSFIRRKIGSFTVQILAIPLVWVFIGYLYGFTPLGIIGDQIAIFQAPYFPGIVRITSVAGITFLILLSNSLVTLWILTKRKQLIVWIAGFLCVLAVGFFWKLNIKKTEPLRVALIQHNFPIKSSWRFEHKDRVIKTYEDAVSAVAKTADLIIFPQYGLPLDVLREPGWLSNLAVENKTNILLGTYIPKVEGDSLTEGKKIDTAILFSKDGSLQQYQAINPPPFRHIKQVVGNKRAPLMLNGVKIGILLCYEDTRPGDAQLWLKEGAQVLVALSNPGHFLGTPLPRYHLLQDRIRAIETKRFIARVSPNGFSAIIDPNGKILTRSNLKEEKILRGVIYP